MVQGSPSATGGDADATGGNGGNADTGNTQIGNGNSVALSIGGKHADADARGGDTEAKSGDAYGGDGGNAKASGGDADASNGAFVDQRNESYGGEQDHWYGCCRSKQDDREESSQSNSSDVVQGSPSATGGDADATGGDGGNADTGNEQFLNGNSIALSFAPGDKLDEERYSDDCGCRKHDDGRNEARAQGGDTSAYSGDAYGGDGGNAKASGGDADASNDSYTKQLNESYGGREDGSQSNSSELVQGSPSATGGDADATGGDGGYADTGNEQWFNGNAIALSFGKHAEADARGGDTSAYSGDAYGGDGGNAKASGGDADASNHAGVKQGNFSSGREEHGREEGRCRGKKDDREDGSQSNSSEVVQGSPSATGGDADATGGDGGYADTGNEQFGNGNAYAQPEEGGPRPDGYDEGDRGDCRDKRDDRGGASAEGGDTDAWSGDAFGGDGGDAKAIGGDASASNAARVLQLNEKGGWL
jgi:hypothetical protein